MQSPRNSVEISPKKCYFSHMFSPKPLGHFENLKTRRGSDFFTRTAHFCSKYLYYISWPSPFNSWAEGERCFLPVFSV
jgi:hypothetical protein